MNRTMTSILAPTTTTPQQRSGLATAFRMLWRDKLALIAALFLTIVVLGAILGPMLVGPEATTMNLRMRNAAPFQLDKGWLFFLGADTLGRSILARIMVASRNTMAVAAGAVLLSALIGTTLGLIAGYRGGWVASIIMRLADILMSFPSLLLAVVVLYVLEPRVSNVVLVLAITRVPVYLRTVRAEVLEVRERMFVLAARVMGASPWRIIWRHILPVVVPTLITVATLDFAFIMLAESSLSFLGLGIQPPEISWGLMVADGRNYLSSAWWLAFWPGLAIMLTTTALNLLSNWVRIATDPKQRWRLEQSRKAAPANAGDDDE
ncbi:MAG: transporter permease [Xanthobacteraceae bacterium]|jgi:peptide/nickel transport system permease protein|nr:transporter permease [Xanthobacteraceae bacterium]